MYTPYEDRESSKEALFLGIEQVIAPRDGVTERLVSRWHISRSTRQHLQTLVEPLEQGLWGQEFDACRC